MSLWLLAAAGVVAGAVNAVVGSGTLLTYPLLVAYGLPPVVANGTNTVGIFPAGLSGAVGYRRELRGRGRRLAPFVVLVVTGAVIGSVLVVALPGSVFESVVPWLILAACVLVLVGPRITRWLARRGVDAESAPWALVVPVLFVTGIYGGYFGAAIGIILMATLTLVYESDLQLSNGAKNLLAGSGNAAGAIVFAVAGRVDWTAGVVVALGATVGGSLGAPFARRLPAPVLRGLVVATGLVAATVALIRR